MPLEKVYVYKAHANGQLYSSTYQTLEERYCDKCRAYDEMIVEAGPFDSYKAADEWIKNKESESGCNDNSNRSC